jgi:phage repressor protein C with HTH and peptisase S24 domain
VLKIFRVIGSSMEPTLSDGDYVVAATHVWRPRVGKLVVATHQDYGILIKRLRQKSAEGCTLTSDNPLGIDSRALGEIPEQQLIGPVLLKIRRPGGVKHISQKQGHAPTP